jgi:hypothetical protein
VATYHTLPWFRYAFDSGDGKISSAASFERVPPYPASFLECHEYAVDAMRRFNRDNLMYQIRVIRMVPVDTLPIEADRTMTPKDVYVAFEVKP